MLLERSGELPKDAAGGVTAPSAVLAESLRAVDLCKAQSGGACGLIVTTSPAVALAGKALALEQGVTSADIADIALRLARFGWDVIRVFEENAALAGHALMIARLAPQLEPLVYKAWLVSRTDLGSDVAIASTGFDAIGEKEIWHRLFVSGKQFRGIVAGESARDTSNCRDDDDNVIVPNWSTRLSFESKDSILYGVLGAVPSRLASLFGVRGDIVLISKNSLMKDCAWRLAARGFRVVQAAAGKDSKPLKPAECPVLPPNMVSDLRKCLAHHLMPLIQSRYLDALAQSFVERANASLVEYQVSVEHWKDVFAQCKNGQPRAVLTNYNVTPTGMAAFNACRERQIPHFCVQHGAGFELATTQSVSPYRLEGAACGTYIAFSQASLRRLGQQPVVTSKLIAVGQPSDLVSACRRRFGYGPRSDICYVSCQALAGTRLPPSYTGVSDLESLKWETEIIERVLKRLDHAVLFKPYPARRFEDGNPFVAAARSAGLNVFTDSLDLRYLLAQTRVLVVNHASSTLNWCVMSRKPVVYLHDSRQSPLFEDFERALRQSCIVVDCAESGFHETLYRTLNRPVDEIEREYAAKAPVRERMIEEYFGVCDGLAGKRLADAIISEIDGAGS